MTQERVKQKLAKRRIKDGKEMVEWDSRQEQETVENRRIQCIVLPYNVRKRQGKRWTRTEKAQRRDEKVEKKERMIQ